MKIIAPSIEDRIQEDEIQMIVPSTVRLKTDKIALIDADYIKYFVCNAIKKDLERKLAYVYEDPAIKYTKFYVNNILKSFDCPGFIFCFSGSAGNTFRNVVSFEKKYKGQRVYTPLYDGELTDKSTCIHYIKERYPTLLYKDLEADDLLSMLQDSETFVYSMDKDLIQVPGTHYDIRAGSFYEITNDQALKFFMTQMLKGDDVDNILGLRGYGEVKSRDLLTNYNSKDSVIRVLQQYILENGYINGVDMFVESWNLLRLRGNRGTYFLSNYQGAFDVLKMIKLNSRTNE